MNAGLPRASDKTGMTPTPSLITGMASLTATIAPLSPTMMAAMVSRESEIAFVSYSRLAGQPYYLQQQIGFHSADSLPA